MLIIIPRFKLWFSFAPLGALYIASVLEKKGVKVSLIEANRFSEAGFYSKLDEEIRPHDTVGISANVSHAASGLEIAGYIRRKYPDRKIIWGGPYASTEYSWIIPKYGDIAVIGEGERQITEIAACKSLDSIRGIAYFSGGQVKLNERCSFIEDLDELPFPAWHLVDPASYDFPGRKPAFSMMTQRGCPFRCINCSTYMHGNSFRSRSFSDIADEMEFLVEKYGCREIHVWDDNFTLDPERVKKICSEIMRRGLEKKIRLSLSSGIRADIYDEEMFDLMKRAGVYYMNVAVESGNQGVIDKIGKGLDLEKVPVTLECLERKGFRIGLFFMMGFPFETLKNLRETAEFAASLPGHHVYFFTVTPFPGTGLLDMVADTKTLLDHYRSDYVNYETGGVKYSSPPEFKEKDLCSMQRYGYRKFYMDFRRLYRIFRAMTRDGGWHNDIMFIFRNLLKIISGGHR